MRNNCGLRIADCGFENRGLLFPLLLVFQVFSFSAFSATNEIFLFPAQPIKAVRVQRGTNDVAIRFLNSTNAVRPFVMYRRRGTTWQAFQTNAVIGKHLTAEKVAEAMDEQSGPKPSDRFKNLQAP